MTITEFILARIAEDEAVANDDEWVREHIQYPPLHPCQLGWENDSEYGDTYLTIAPARVLAQCKAMKRIVDEYEQSEFCERDVLGEVAGHLAAIWSDHPDYDPAWRA